MKARWAAMIVGAMALGAPGAASAAGSPSALETSIAKAVIAAPGAGAPSAFETSVAQAAKVGFFRTRGDNTHKSRNKDGSWAVSAHGWWEDINSGEPRARVRVWVQQHWRDWTTIGYNWGDIPPGSGGSGRRVPARGNCTVYPGHGYHWRSVVDVDIVGKDDSNEQYVSPEQRLDCSARGIGPAR